MGGQPKHLWLLPEVTGTRQGYLTIANFTFKKYSIFVNQVGFYCSIMLHIDVGKIGLAVSCKVPYVACYMCYRIGQSGPGVYKNDT